MKLTADEYDSVAKPMQATINKLLARIATFEAALDWYMAESGTGTSFDCHCVNGDYEPRIPPAKLLCVLTESQKRCFPVDNGPKHE